MQIPDCGLRLMITYIKTCNAKIQIYKVLKQVCLLGRYDVHPLLINIKSSKISKFLMNQIF